MDRWGDLTATDADFAARARARFESARHHILSTLRRDGSPRVSGTEIQFFGDDLMIGMMPGSVKALDLRRDGRYALHAHPGDGSMEGGDAKVSGVAVEVDDPDVIDAYRRHIVEVMRERGDAPPADETTQDDDDESDEDDGFEFGLFRLHLRDVVVTSIHPEGDRLRIEIWRPGCAVEVVERT
ncbi:MAG: pyridoxamine 5'-phosphate oxidase family protein [Actinomycetota bacterium]